MVSTSYVGDSDGKRVARASFWLAAIQSMTRIVPGPILYLASRDAGDYRCLRGWGGGLEDRAVGYDIDPDAIRLAQERYPAARLALGDITESEHLNRADIVFIDTCSNASNTLCALIRKISREISVGCLLGIGFMMGREMDRANVAIGNRRWRRRIGFDRVSNAPTQETTDPKVLTVERRLGIVRAAIGAVAELLHVQIYNSGHTPMVYALFRYGVPWKGRESVPGIYEPIPIRSAALQFLSQGIPPNDVADILNVDARTVAAWAAHRTMGTYQ